MSTKKITSTKIKNMRDRENKKCKKGQESTIGKIIYGFLLFMPLIAIGVTCGYAMFNKNAYKSYGDSYVQQYNEITSEENIIVNQQYLITYKEVQGGYYTPTQFYYSDIDIDWYDYRGTDTNHIYVAFGIRGYQFPNTIWVYYYDNNNTLQHDIVQEWGDEIKTIYFTLDSFVIGGTGTKPYDLFMLNYKTISISDVFYYSVDKVTGSPLFNWAQNSVIYTTTNTTCNALSITTPFIPLLMSYWLIISIIYFLYDIALMLVWLIHKKIHELQESL